jgi:hypothetical protein
VAYNFPITPTFRNDGLVLYWYDSRLYVHHPLVILECPLTKKTADIQSNSLKGFVREVPGDSWLGPIFFLY